MPETVDVVALVRQSAKRHGVDPNFAQSILIAEGWSPRTQTSPAGAAGPMQLMPATARGLGLRVEPGNDERYNIPKNIDAGVRYLAQLSSQYGGDPALTAMAYNGGGGAVQAYRRGQLASYGRGETQRYVNKVIPTYRRLTQEGGGGDHRTVDNNTGAGVTAPRRPGAAAAAAATARTPKATPQQDAYLQLLQDQINEATRQRDEKKAALDQYYKDRQDGLDKRRAGVENAPIPPKTLEATLKTEIQRADSLVNSRTSAYNTYKGGMAKAGDKGETGPKATVTTSRGPRGTTRTTTISGSPEDLASAGGSIDDSAGDEDPGAMTDYQAGQLGLGAERVDIQKQQLELDKIKAQYTAGQLSFDKAKYMIDKILDRPAVSTVGGKRYEAGYEPGSGMLAFAKKYGISIDPKEYTDIDYAGLLGMPEANKYIRSSSNPFTEKSLTPEEVASGDYRPGGSKALPGLPQTGGLSLPTATAEGSNTLGPPDEPIGDATNQVNPSPGEVDKEPPAPPPEPGGSPPEEMGGATQRPPAALAEPRRDISEMYPPLDTPGTGGNTLGPPAPPSALIAPPGGPTLNGMQPSTFPGVGIQPGQENFPQAPMGTDKFSVTSNLAGRPTADAPGGMPLFRRPGGPPASPTPSPMPGGPPPPTTGPPPPTPGGQLAPPSNLGMEDSGLGPPPEGAGAGGKLAPSPGDDNHAKIVAFLTSKGATQQEAEQAAQQWFMNQMRQVA